MRADVERDERERRKREKRRKRKRDRVYTLQRSVTVSGGMRRKGKSGTAMSDEVCIHMIVYHHGTEYSVHCSAFELNVTRNTILHLCQNLCKFGYFGTDFGTDFGTVTLHYIPLTACSASA